MVRLDNRASDGESQTHSVLLSCKKRTRNAIPAIRRNAMTAVHYTHPNNSRSICFGSKRELPLRRGCIVHGIHAIQNKIQQHLLQLQTITLDLRKIRLEFLGNLNTAPQRIARYHSNDTGQRFIKAQRLELKLPFAEQGADSADCSIRPQVVVANVRQNLAHLIEPWFLGLQQDLCSLGIAENSAERLVDLMSHHGGHLSYDRQS